MSRAQESPDVLRVRIDLDAYCHDCQPPHRHRLGRTPQGFTDELWEWEAKHHGHTIEFLSPRRRLPPHFDDRPYQRRGEAPWWLEIRENANIKIAYASSVALTIGLATGPLASSTTFLAGRESTVIDNTSNLYIDGRLTARITTGTTPTVDTEIRVYGYTSLDDTPTYPDTITGTDGTRTLTNAYILENALLVLGATGVAATSNITYPIRLLSVAEAFGLHPKRCGVFVVHNTGVNLNATGGNHVLAYTGAYITSV